MEFIAEQLIENTTQELSELDGNLQSIIEEIETQQPVLLAYIFSDDFKLLTTPERDYLLYLLLVIWKTLNNSGQTIPIVDEEMIGKKEEENWTILQASKAKHFRDKIDVFFEAYPQEDLLAFVEDGLADDEDNEDDFITKIGREPMFIALKTIIDVLTKS